MVQEKKSYELDLEKEEHWIGHILRDESLQREVIECRMIGKIPREENESVC